MCVTMRIELLLKDIINYNISAVRIQGRCNMYVKYWLIQGVAMKFVAFGSNV